MAKDLNDNLSQGQPRSAEMVYASSRPSASGSRWFRQLGVICRLNCILLVRYWKAALVQVILLPLVAIGAIYGIQKSVTSSNGKSNAANSAYSTWDLPGIPMCQPERDSGKCMTLVYAPENTETSAIMSQFQSTNQKRTGSALAIESSVWDDMTKSPQNNMGIVPMPSESFLYNYSLAFPDTIQYGIVFTKQQPVAAGPTNWAYQVYYNATKVTNTSTLPNFAYSLDAGTEREDQYDDKYGGFLTSLIRAVDESLITFLDPTKLLAEFKIQLSNFPTAASKNGYSSGDQVYENVGNLLALPACVTMVMAMLRVAREKESKCKESMMMMGLSSGAYWTAQWLTTIILTLSQSLMLVALAYAFKLTVFVASSALIWIIFFFLFTYSFTLMGLGLSTLIRRAQLSLGLGFAVVIMTLILIPIMQMQWLSLYANMDLVYRLKLVQRTYTFVLCYIFPFLSFPVLYSQLTSVGTGITNPITGEYTPGQGMSWYNMTHYSQSERVLQDVLPQPTGVYVMLVSSIIFWCLFAYYFDNVVPNEHGYSKGWLFFLRGWRSALGGSESRQLEKATRVYPFDGEHVENEDSDVIAERERTVNCTVPVAVRISNLTKIYTKTTSKFLCFGRRKVLNKAVNHLNLICSENELYCCLGQNGAGKSTTMQMLYGVTRPNSGQAFVFNRSIQDDMTQIQSELGVCPQHDVLFADLTCMEHMQLYAGIKDLPAGSLLAHSPLIRSRLEAVLLWESRNTMAGRLSGGMKRRLSTILSTLGDPKVLILDEPTTGMDPVNRRHVWSFLARFKMGRSILLTTHSMEEADALGDKVGIMVAGHLKAVGNTTRLKNKFGNGYRVEIALGTDNTTTDSDVILQHKMAVTKELTDTTLRLVPNARILDQSGGILVFGIPMQSLTSMSQLTQMLEKAQQSGRIKNWGISQTTLEEVFLALIRASDDRH